MSIARFLHLLPLISSISELASALQLCSHNASFVPDAVLTVNKHNASVGGIFRESVLVNGSLPGPKLTFPENEVVWIRVYNDMTDANLTMVSVAHSVMAL
jgi:hypothetical protein